MRRASSECGELDIPAADWDAYLAAYPARPHVDIGDVVSADLRAGLMTSRLSLELVTAQRVKLLWMRNAFAILALQTALRERLR